VLVTQPLENVINGVPGLMTLQSGSILLREGLEALLVIAALAAFLKRAGVPADKYSFAFQSRLGSHPWLQPFTDHELPKLAARGIKKLLVICPSFVSDCLETLEEIGIRARATFLEAGGSELTLIPCLNEHPLWLEALQKMIGGFTGSAEGINPPAAEAPLPLAIGGGAFTALLPAQPASASSKLPATATRRFLCMTVLQLYITGPQTDPRPARAHRRGRISGAVTPVHRPPPSPASRGPHRCPHR